MVHHSDDVSAFRPPKPGSNAGGGFDEAAVNPSVHRAVGREQLLGGAAPKDNPVCGDLDIFGAQFGVPRIPDAKAVLLWLGHDVTVQAGVVSQVPTGG